MKYLRNTLRLAAVLTVGFCLSACSTTYGDMGAFGGVAAVPVTSDIYRVSARGNGYTDSTTIQDFVLLKAAETTLGAGQSHFTVVDGRDATSNSTGQTAGTLNNWGGGFMTYNPGITYDIVKPGEDLMIRVWTPKSGEALPPGTYPAQEVFDNVNSRVKRTKTA